MSRCRASRAATAEAEAEAEATVGATIAAPRAATMMIAGRRRAAPPHATFAARSTGSSSRGYRRLRRGRILRISFAKPVT